MESVRAAVTFALTTQPGQPCAALDGDAYAVVPLSYLEGKVPASWLDEIGDKLLEQHVVDYTGNSPHPKRMKGVSTLSFHRWAARQVINVDPSFHPGDVFIGRGRNARAIIGALSLWAAKGDA